MTIKDQYVLGMPTRRSTAMGNRIVTAAHLAWPCCYHIEYLPNFSMAKMKKTQAPKKRKATASDDTDYIGLNLSTEETD